MKAYTNFFGWAALVAFVFGVVSWFSLGSGQSYLSIIHFVMALVFLVLFALGGGKESLFSSTAKRKAGFGVAATLYSVMFVAIVAGLNYLSYHNNFFRYDSSEQKVFSLAPQTEQVVGKLKEKIEIKGFFLGGVVTKTPVTNLLELLERESELIDFEILDPEKNPLLADRYGVSENETLVFKYSDGAVDRQTRIVGDITEQRVVNALIKLERGKGKKVYYLTGHGEPSVNSQTEEGYLFLAEAIRGENIQLERLLLDAGKTVPSDASALIISSPEKDLIESEKQSILKYIEAGGAMLLLLEPRSPSSVLEISKLLGISGGQSVVAENVVSVLDGSKVGLVPRALKYGRHKITEKFLKPTIYEIATSLDTAAKTIPDASYTRLALSSDRAWGETDLAGVFEGELESSKTDSDIDGPLTLAMAVENKNQRAVVFGDGDFVRNRNIRKLFNRDFFLNSLNWVIDEDDGIVIRPKTMKQSVSGISQNNLSYLFFSTVILLPELIILSGLFFWRRRIS